MYIYCFIYWQTHAQINSHLPTTNSVKLAILVFTLVSWPDVGIMLCLFLCWSSHVLNVHCNIACAAKKSCTRKASYYRQPSSGNLAKEVFSALHWGALFNLKAVYVVALIYNFARETQIAGTKVIKYNNIIINIDGQRIVFYARFNSKASGLFSWQCSNTRFTYIENLWNGIVMWSDFPFRLFYSLIKSFWCML